MTGPFVSFRCVIPIVAAGAFLLASASAADAVPPASGAETGNSDGRLALNDAARNGDQKKKAPARAAPPPIGQKAAPTRQIINEDLQWGQINGANVNIRTGPSTQNTVVTTLHGGDFIRARATHGTWLEIEWPQSVPAWIPREQLQIPDGEVSPNTIVSTKVAGRVYSRGSVQSTAIAKVEKGAKLTVLGEENGWFKIKAPENAIAFISAKYVLNGIQAPEKLSSSPSADAVMGKVPGRNETAAAQKPEAHKAAPTEETAKKAREETEAEARRVSEAKKQEEEATRLAIEARKQAEEEQARRIADARKQEEESARLAAEAKKKVEVEQQALHVAEAKRKEEEEAAKLASEAKKRALDEAEQARHMAETQRKEAEEATRLATEARKQAEAEERARRAAETRRKAEEESARIATEAKRKEMEEAARLATEAKKQADAEEQARRVAEGKRKAEEEAATETKRKELEEATRLAEAARKRAEAEEQARQVAEARKQEEETKRKAEEEAQDRRIAEAKLHAQDEAARMKAEAAKKADEEIARKKPAEAETASEAFAEPAGTEKEKPVSVIPDARRMSIPIARPLNDDKPAKKGGAAPPIIIDDYQPTENDSRIENSKDEHSELIPDISRRVNSKFVVPSHQPAKPEPKAEAVVLDQEK